MRRQNGQAMVEFAFMTPLMCMMIFGLIYGAVIFMDYLNFSNDARAVARRIAVTTNEEDRKELIEYYNKAENSQFARFYTVTRKVAYGYPTKEQEKKQTVMETNEDGESVPVMEIVDGVEVPKQETVTEIVDGVEVPVMETVEDTDKDPIDIVVTVSFKRNNNDVPGVLNWVNFPPAHFAIKYTMKLEKTDTSGSEG